MPIGAGSVIPAAGTVATLKIQPIASAPAGFTSFNLRIVVINTNGQSIPDDTKIPAGFKL